MDELSLGALWWIWIGFEGLQSSQSSDHSQGSRARKDHHHHQRLLVIGHLFCFIGSDIFILVYVYITFVSQFCSHYLVN